MQCAERSTADRFETALTVQPDQDGWLPRTTQACYLSLLTLLCILTMAAAVQPTSASWLWGNSPASGSDASAANGDGAFVRGAAASKRGKEELAMANMHSTALQRRQCTESADLDHSITLTAVHREHEDSNEEDPLAGSTGIVISSKDIAQIEGLPSDQIDPDLRAALRTMLVQSKQLDCILSDVNEDVKGSTHSDDDDDCSSASSTDTDALLRMQRAYANVDCELEQLLEKLDAHGHNGGSSNARPVTDAKLSNIEGKHRTTAWWWTNCTIL